MEVPERDNLLVQIHFVIVMIRWTAPQALRLRARALGGDQGHGGTHEFVTSPDPDRLRLSCQDVFGCFKVYLIEFRPYVHSGRPIRGEWLMD